MLRSFAYAASAAEILRGVERAGRLGGARARASSSTATSTTVDPALLPAGREAIERLLSVFELEKAVYELRYELDNRPDWVSIPVAGILRLLEEQRRRDRARRDPHASSARIGEGGVVVGYRPGERCACCRAASSERRLGGCEACSTKASCRSTTSSRSYPDGDVRCATRTRSCRRSASSTHLAGEGGTRALRAARRARASRRRRRRVRGLGAERRSVASSATSTLGRRCIRCARSARPGSGSFRPGVDGTVQVRDPDADGQLRLKADPFAFHAEVPPKNASRRLPVALRVGATTTGSSAAAASDPLHGAGLDLRGAPRLVAAEASAGNRSSPTQLADYVATTSASRTSSCCR